MRRTAAVLFVALSVLASAIACGGSPDHSATASPRPSAMKETRLWLVHLDNQNLGRGRILRLRTGQLDIVVTVSPGSSSSGTVVGVIGELRDDLSRGVTTVSPSPGPAFSWRVTQAGRSEKHFRLPAGRWFINVSSSPGLSATVVVTEAR